MDRVRLERTGKRPLEFEGELLTEVATSPDRASVRWSGTTGRWWKVQAYRTVGGKYILAIHHYTQWQGEKDAHEAHAFNTLEEAIAYLEEHGPSQAAQEIAEELGVVENLE